MSIIPDKINSGHIEKNHDHSVYAEERANVNRNHVEISERTLSIISFGFAVAAFVTALWAIHEADRSAQETRQLQIQVMDHNALLIREGLAQPTDEVYGPAGNLEYKRKK